MLRLRLILALVALAEIALGAGLALQREPPSVLSVPPPPVPVAGASERVETDLRALAGTVRGEDGAALEGALACAHPLFDAPVTCAATDRAGAFALRVPAGLHKLAVRPPPDPRHVAEWHEDADRSRLASPLDLRQRDRTDLAVALAQARRVSGRVAAARDGAPVVDATVCAGPVDEPGEWVCERTDRTGRYALAVLPRRYSIFFVPPEGTRLVPLWWDGHLEVVVADFLDARRADAAEVDAALVEGHLIQGTVRATSGVPVEHALVCVDTPLPTGRICRPTDKEGRYSVAVRRGTFVVQFRPRASSLVVSAWHAGTRDPRGARRVVVNGDVRVDGELESGKILWGGIRSRASGIPIEGANVNVYDATRPCCVFVAGAVTGPSGDYATVVPPGRYWVEAFPPIGTPYLSAFVGGTGAAEDARVIEVTVKDDDVLAEVSLDEFR